MRFEGQEVEAGDISEPFEEERLIEEAREGATLLSSTQLSYHSAWASQCPVAQTGSRIAQSQEARLTCRALPPVSGL